MYGVKSCRGHTFVFKKKFRVVTPAGRPGRGAAACPYYSMHIGNSMHRKLMSAAGGRAPPARGCMFECSYSFRLIAAAAALSLSNAVRARRARCWQPWTAASMS